MNKAKRTVTPKIIIILVLIISTSIFVWNKYLKKPEDFENTVQTYTYTVKKGDITEAVTASGNVETANYLPITTSVNGIVKNVFVSEGEKVTKGQKIMEITLNSEGEETLAQAWGSYLSAKNNLDKAKTDLLTKEAVMINAGESFEDEKEKNSYQSHDERTSYRLAEITYITAKENFSQQESTIKQAQVAVNKAWLSYQAQSPIIVAPDNGVIANIVVVEGMNISNSLSERTSTSVASIKKEGNPIVSLDLSEVDINKIKVGQKVDITLDSIDNKSFKGEVVGIDKLGIVSGGVTSYKVIIRFDESSDLVLPNMGVDGNIVINEKSDVLIVPSSAITSERRETYVTLDRNESKTKIPVTIGLSDGQFTEIMSGINEGDKVIVTELPTKGFSESQSQNTRNNFRGPGMFLR